MEALVGAGLTANPDKCVWGAQSLEYFGNKIGHAEARVKALRDYHRPKHQKGLSAFLGTACYHRKFIPDFDRWACPLFDALKKGTPCFLKWNKRESDAFNHIISVLCDEHSLTIPRADDEFILHTDASVLGIGAVL